MEAHTGFGEQLAQLVDAVADYAIFMLDLEGTVLTWNNGARRIKGYEPHEIIGQSFTRFYLDEDREREHPQHELEIARREGRYEEEGWRLRKDGSRFWANVLITAVRDEEGELVGFGKVTRDLTARRLAEEQLRANAADLTQANAELEQFRLLVANVRDYAIFMLDPSGRIRTWNEGAAHIKGWSEAEVIGKEFSLFYTQEDLDRRHPQYELEVAAREGRYEEEGWRLRKDGGRFWANVVITPIRDERGVLNGYAKITRDLTRRRQAEEELRATADELARSNTELERFASSAAHDLASPLATIAGLADLLVKRYGTGLDDEGRTYLELIRGGAASLRSMVDGLLSYARAAQRDLHPRPISLASVLEEVVGGLRSQIEESRADVVYEPAALPVVEADADLLAVVMRNLISNGVKFNEHERPRVEVDAAREASGWRISVSDDGIGISNEELGRVFEMFHRLHSQDRFEGTGLGLALSLRIVERHGGEMGVESGVGEGSRFWFTLPARDGAASPGREPDPPPS